MGRLSVRLQSGTERKFGRRETVVVGSGFVHLHVHTEYSLLDGAARINELMEAAGSMGMPALGVTDHGVLYALVDFYEAGKRFGIKPILGMEAYVAPGSRFERTRASKEYFHLTLLAGDDRGYRNILKLASLASLEGFFYKPRVDLELLSTHHEGIIAASGCLAGEPNQLLLKGDVDGARESLATYRDIFGAENFYVELQDHGLEDQHTTLPHLVDLARELRLPLLATNDLHYTKQEDAAIHDVLLCVQTASTLGDPKRFKFGAEEFYLKSPEAMRRLFSEFPSSCDNTLEVAERCNVEIEFGTSRLPAFPIPEGYTPESWLSEEAYRGAARRYGDPLPAKAGERIAHELGVISQTGFASYFLIVADLVAYAKRSGIRVGPGRGSAAGSAVSYCLGITELEPLRYGLIFERFLNPERRQMPDIDMDFDERRRGDMIRYATEKYGEDHVAQIVTFSTIKARAAVRDAARVLSYPYGLGDRLSKMMPPPVQGRDSSLAEALRTSADLKEACNSDPDARRVLDTALGLEGLRRQWSVHAAGVVISPGPLVEHCPVQRRESDGAIVTQYEMHGVEKLGLLKMDFLGLRNLTVIDDAVKHIGANRGEIIDPNALPLDDRDTYALLCRGDTIATFQLEGTGMRSLMRALEPSRFEDVCALIALYRPGPMGANMHIEYVERKHGRKPVVCMHPDMEAILADTWGIVCYQEQVLEIAVRMAGYTMGEADELRRAMGKKIREELAGHKEKFTKGIVAKGYPEKLGRDLFDLITPFADYAFNRAHATGYGLVAYQTAYLKAHYPVEYMAAILTSVKDDKDKSALYLSECRRMGIRVLPPDVNASDVNFTPKGEEIRFGLSAVRNVGEQVVADVIRARREKGAFTSFFDFLDKVDAAVLNKRVVESLVKSGAFDSFDVSRKALADIYEAAIERVVTRKRAEAAGQFSLFGGREAPAVDAHPSVGEDEWDKTTRLSFEREMLGLYVSDHPLLGVEDVLMKLCDHTVPGLAETKDGAVVTVGGILSHLTKRFTKKGEPFVNGYLEDLEGSVETIFFPQVYQSSAAFLAEDAVVVVKGRIDSRDDSPKLVALEVAAPDLRMGPGLPVVLRVPAHACTDSFVDRLRQVLSNHQGKAPVHLRLETSGRTMVVRLGDEYRVARVGNLFAELKALMGPDAVVA
ncbi:MAG: DNA polymerase III subunit alpha [Actinomycetota bacterium]